MPKKGRASRTTGRKINRSSQGKKSIMSKTKRKQLVSKGQKKVKMLGQKIKAKGAALSRKSKSKSKFNFISFLSRIAKLKMSKATFVMKSLTPLLQENRVILFGGLAEPITRAQISEPYNAGTVQGPVLYGVGTGPQNAPKPGGDYSSFIDLLPDAQAEYIHSHIVVGNAMDDDSQLGGGDSALPMHSDSRISRCWATAIALTFGQGKSLHKSENPLIWDWDKSGGGTNHEMEHAIKCITQAMLNFLSQSNTTDEKTMHTVLYDFFVSILRGQGKEDRAKKISQQITKLLRKQQVIAGLPSCSLFNQFKCALDLIKIKLKQIPGEGWFYVSVEPDEDEILKVVKKMKAGKDQSGKMEEGSINQRVDVIFMGWVC